MLKSINDSVIKLPFYAKISLILIGLFVFIEMLCIGKNIIVPLLFAIVLSILFSTLVDFLEKKNINRVLAIIITILAAIFVARVEMVTAIIATLTSKRFSNFPARTNGSQIVLP